MATETLKTIENRIRRLRRLLANAGNMRPGTLGVQYRRPAEKKAPFHQISYTRKGHSRSEYVRPENLSAVRLEIAAYRRFKILLDQLLDLSIRASRLRCGTRLAAPKARPVKSRPPKCT